MITSLVTLGATVVGNVGLIWWKWNDPAVLAKVAASQATATATQRDWRMNMSEYAFPYTIQHWIAAAETWSDGRLHSNMLDAIVGLRELSHTYGANTPKRVLYRVPAATGYRDGSYLIWEGKRVPDRLGQII